MLRINAVCLGHKEKFTDNYQTIHQLKDVVFEKYKTYLVNKNVKETRINFILTYMNKTTGNEELLEDINIIPNDGQWFHLYVKRVCIIITTIVVLLEIYSTPWLQLVRILRKNSIQNLRK